MVIAVEPVLWGCIAYKEFAQLWKDAMHSVGKFEDYMPPEYWKEVIQKAGFKITLEKTVKWRTYVPPTVLRNIVETTMKSGEISKDNSTLVGPPGFEPGTFALSGRRHNQARPRAHELYSYHK